MFLEIVNHLSSIFVLVMSYFVVILIIDEVVLFDNCDSSRSIGSEIRNISSCTYEKKSDDGNGRQLILNLCVFIECKSSGYDGVICCYLATSSSTSVGSFGECIFIRCSSYLGGGVYWYSYGSFSLDLIKCNIDDCTASGSGGRLF